MLWKGRPPFVVSAKTVRSLFLEVGNSRLSSFDCMAASPRQGAPGPTRGTWERTTNLTASFSH